MSTGARPRDSQGAPSQAAPRSPTEPAAYLPASDTPPPPPPEGPCFLLLRLTDGGTFAKVNPFALRRAIGGLYGEVATAKAIRSGALLIQTAHSHQTVTLLGTRTIMDLPVEPQLADRLNSVTGSVSSDLLVSLTNTDLLEELVPQGVVMVQRLASRDVDRWGPNPTIKLSFGGHILPQTISCGYAVIPVHPWVPAPKLCREC